MSVIVSSLVVNPNYIFVFRYVPPLRSIFHLLLQTIRSTTKNADIVILYPNKTIFLFIIMIANNTLYAPFRAMDFMYSRFYSFSSLFVQLSNVLNSRRYSLSPVSTSLVNIVKWATSIACLSRICTYQSNFLPHWYIRTVVAAIACMHTFERKFTIFG